MSVWSWLSERRRWGAEIKDVPQQQFRRMVEGTMFYRDPAKQKWASGVLWRREHLWNHPIALAGLVVAIVGPILNPQPAFAPWPARTTNLKLQHCGCLGCSRDQKGKQKSGPIIEAIMEFDEGHLEQFYKLFADGSKGQNNQRAASDRTRNAVLGARTRTSSIHTERRGKITALNFLGHAMHDAIAQRVIIPVEGELFDAFAWEIMGMEQIWTK